MALRPPHTAPPRPGPSPPSHGRSTDYHVDRQAVRSTHVLFRPGRRPADQPRCHLRRRSPRPRLPREHHHALSMTAEHASAPPPGAPHERPRERPRQIQLPPPPPAPSAPRLRGPATAPILGTAASRRLLQPPASPAVSPLARPRSPRSPTSQKPPPGGTAAQRRSYPARAQEPDVDYFSLPHVSPAVSTGLQLGLGRPHATQAQTDLRFVRPVMLNSDQLGHLAERAVSRSLALSPSLFSASSLHAASPYSQSPTLGWPIPSRGGVPRTSWSRPLSPEADRSRPTSSRSHTAHLPSREAGNMHSPSILYPAAVGRRTSCSSMNVLPPGSSAEALVRTKSMRSTPDVTRDLVSPAASLGGSGVRLGDFQETRTNTSTSPAGGVREGAQTPAADTLGAQPGAEPPGLHGLGGGTQFGAAVRKKLASTLESLIHRGPLPPREPGRIVQVAEYGAVLGRGYPLIQTIIALIAEAMDNQPLLPTSDSGLSFPPDELDTNFWVMHCDAPGTDFRGLMSALESDPDSYLAPGWAARTRGVTSDGVYHSFTDRPFGACVAPRASIDFGVSIMDLHWGHNVQNRPSTSDRANAVIADAELTQFLRARARELRRGAHLVVAYIARGESSSRPTSVSRRRHAETPGSEHLCRSASTTDVWAVLSGLLAPSIQRLVSCGMLQADVARYMLTLPLYPRTTAQSVATLRAQNDLWQVDWACGLGEYPNESRAPAFSPSSDDSVPSEESLPYPASEPDPLRLPHPAWVSYDAGALSRVSYSEHVIALIKNLYETHWRSLLSSRGRLSKGAVAFTLDSIYDVLQTRLDSPDVPLHRIEFEICIYLLRRR